MRGLSLKFDFTLPVTNKKFTKKEFNRNINTISPIHKRDESVINIKIL